MARESIQGIVIGVVKHSDKSNVVTLFTRTRGRVAFISSAGTGKAGRARNARLMPLCVIESEVNFIENRELQMLNAVSSLETLHDLYFNPVKSSIVVFISEFLNRYLRETPPDSKLWDYIRLSLRMLNEMRGGEANFHIYFLIRMLGHAGILPHQEDIDISNGAWFDMRTGSFTKLRPLHSDVVEPVLTPRISLLLRMTASNMHRYRFSRAERTEILNRLLQYFSIHYPSLHSMKTLGILTEIFD